jgi:hypothetical protein
MDLTSIVSITGMPGLYKVISKTQNSLVVESLIDKKRFPVFASHQTTSLEDISVFTIKEDLPLKAVLKKIYEMENKGPAIDSKSDDKKLKEYFEKALPDYDKERVYTSHIKKMIAWYNLLQSLNLLEPTEEELKEEAKDKEEVKVKEETSGDQKLDEKEEKEEKEKTPKKTEKKAEPKVKKETKTAEKKPKKTKE